MDQFGAKSAALALGIAIGAILGAGMANPGAGRVLGVALGAPLEIASQKRRGADQ